MILNEQVHIKVTFVCIFPYQMGLVQLFPLGVV